MITTLDKFISFEEEEKLFDMRINDILIWDYIRFDVYKDIRKQKSNQTYTIKTQDDKSIKTIFIILKQILFVLSHLHAFRINKKKEILILGHSRRIKTANYFKDIYTDDVVGVLKDSNSIITLEHPIDQSHKMPTGIDNIKYLDKIILGYGFFNLFNSVKISTQEIEQMNILQLRIKEVFGSDINIKRIIKTAVNKYRSSFPRIEKIINTVAPKVLIAVNAYNFYNKIFLEIANNKEIPSIELQHGAFGSEHIVYNYPKAINPISFPKYFFAWGNYWHQNAALPEQTKIVNTGFPYINDKQLEISKSLKQQENNILVLSQWTIGFELMNYINDFAKQATEYNFIVKLHPLEFDALDKFKSISKYDNITFITSEKTVYELFAECKTQIGVYSTALVEGLAFNLRTIIIPLEGYKTYSDLIDSGNMYLVENYSDFQKTIKISNKEVEIKNIWEENALQRIKVEVEGVM